MRALLLIIALLPLPFQASRSNGTIAGTVTRLGTAVGILNVRVWVGGGQIGDVRPGESEFETYTDSDGHFELTDVPPGDYMVNASRGGYLRGARKVTVASGKVAGINFPLGHGAVISGRVTRVDGTPLAHETVSGVVGSVSTNDQGEYRFFTVPPGKYRIRVDDGRSGGRGTSRPSDKTFRTIYYPGTASLSEAQSVEVREGDTLSGIDIVALPAVPVEVNPAPATFKISGVLVNPRGAFDNGLMLEAKLVPKGTGNRGAAPITTRLPGFLLAADKADGTRREFQLPGVPNGTYDVSIVVLFTGTIPPLSFRTTVEVAGRDVSGLVLYREN